MEKIELTVEALENPVRADRYIAEHTDISRSRLKGECTLLINGKEAKLSKNVSEGDVISLEIAEVKGPDDIEPQKMDLDIIYEDDNVIVLNKEQGMVVHPAAGNFQGTLVNGLLDYVSGIEEEFDDDTVRPGIVHRLDKDTSGVIIIAKNPQTHEFLSKQFRDKVTRKTYIAIVRGRLPKKHDIIDTYYPRYIDGEWTRAEGVIYPMYESVIIDDLSDEYSEYVLSIDYGTQNAFSAGLWARDGAVWHRIDEYYYSGRETGIQKADDEYADDLDRFTDWLYEPDGNGHQIMLRKIETIIDPSAASFKAMLQKRGRYRVRDADNDVLNGIRNVATSMNRGKIKVHKSCTNWVKEVAGYTWDDKGTDTPIKENDHAMDDTRYFVNTKHIAKERRI